MTDFAALRRWFAAQFWAAGAWLLENFVDVLMALFALAAAACAGTAMWALFEAFHA